MYPNPFGDDITMDFNNIAGTNKVSAFVYDITGRLVFRQDYGSNVYTVVLSANGTIS
jgi:hypothetical protein